MRTFIETMRAQSVEDKYYQQTPVNDDSDQVQDSPKQDSLEGKRPSPGRDKNLAKKH